MLEALEKGALLSLVRSSGDKLKNLSRPEKIYNKIPLWLFGFLY